MNVVMCAVDTYQTADSLYYIHKTATGDISVEMFVESLNGIDSYCRFGLMIRSSLNNNSKYLSLFGYEGGNTATHLRSNDGDSTQTDGTPYTSLPNPLVNAWIKITKIGNTFQTFYKTGTDDWSSALATYTLELSDPYYYGIFLTSVWNNQEATGLGTLPIFSELLPDGWNEGDIGPDHSGASVASSSYTLLGDTIEMTASTGGEYLTRFNPKLSLFVHFASYF